MRLKVDIDQAHERWRKLGEWATSLHAASKQLLGVPESLDGEHAELRYARVAGRVLDSPPIAYRPLRYSTNRQL